MTTKWQTKWETKWETKCGLATGVTLHDPPEPSRTLQNPPYTFRAHTMGGSIPCCLKIGKTATNDDKVGDKVADEVRTSSGVTLHDPPRPSRTYRTPPVLTRWAAQFNAAGRSVNPPPLTTKWQTKWETKCGLAAGVTLQDPPGPSRT